MYLLQFFEYNGLDGRLKPIAAVFAEAAEFIVNRLPDNPERTVALRKLLECRDCALRAEIFQINKV